MSCKVIQERTAAISVPPWTLPQGALRLHTAIPNSPRRNQLTQETMAFPVLLNQDAVKDFYRMHSNFWDSKSCVSFFPKKRKEQKQKNTNQKKNQIKPKQLSVCARCIYCLPTKNKLIIFSKWVTVH